MSRARTVLADLRLLAGSHCLDFANTIEPRLGVANPHDYLHSYADLVAWSQHAGLIDAEIVGRLNRRAAATPGAAEATFHRAVALREAVYSVFSAIATGAEPSPPDLLVIQQAFCETAREMRLTWNSSRVEWQPARENPALDLPVLEIVRSATDLLTKLPAHVVKRCPGADDCGWLFLDTTKNSSRRWCRSEGCGARVKMRRRYQRIHAAQEPDAPTRPYTDLGTSPNISGPCGAASPAG